MKYIFILSLFLSNLCNAGTIDPNVPDSKYLEYGKKYECVYKLSGKQKDGKIFYASAVLIDPNFILTAAHVAENIDESYVETDDTKKNQIILFVYPEQYRSEAFGGNGYDIAIGYLKEKINISYYPELYSDLDELDKICGIAGYGVTGTFDTGIKKSDGQKRAGSNIIERIDNDFLLICSAQNKPTQLEILIAGGDSGGGLFVNQKLAGIHSSVYNIGSEPPNSNKRSFTVHTRISKHKNWIEESIKYIKQKIGQ